MHQDNLLLHFAAQAGLFVLDHVVPMVSAAMGGREDDAARADIFPSRGEVAAPVVVAPPGLEVDFLIDGGERNDPWFFSADEGCWLREWRGGDIFLFALLPWRVS